MSLVVAQIHVGGLTLVGDTKITDYVKGADTANRQVFRHAHPKIAILRRDLAVGVAGDDPQKTMPRVRQMREMAVEEIVEALTKIEYGSFIVATLAPRTLWQITRGSAEPRTNDLRAWIGDPEANVLFQGTYQELQANTGREADFLLSGAMRELISWEHVASVGGYATRVWATSDGFRFGADPASVGPDLVNAIIARTRGGAHLKIETPPEVASRGYNILLAPGDTPTIGALGCLIPEANTAWLFCDATPWGGHTIRADTLDDLARIAKSNFGQNLRNIPVGLL